MQQQRKFSATENRVAEIPYSNDVGTLASCSKKSEANFWVFTRYFS